MNDEPRDGDLDPLFDEAARQVGDALRAAYVSDELPGVGSELAAVFVHGLPGGTVVRPLVPQVGHRGSALSRLLRAKGARIALGAAVVSVNLVGVGAAGLLPGPVQTSFERATDSVGLELPRPAPARREAVPSGGGPADRRGTSSTQAPAAGPAGGSSSSTAKPRPQPQPKKPEYKENKKGGGDRARPSSTVPRTGGRPEPTTLPEKGKGPHDPGPGPGSTVCTSVPAPGPTSSTLPPVSTTVRVPVAGDASGGVPGPPGTLPAAPPGCAP
jgi:hypothetical protein